MPSTASNAAGKSRRIVFLTSGSLWPTWLSRCADQLAAGNDVVAGHWYPVDKQGAFSKALRRIIFTPLRILEARAYSANQERSLDEDRGSSVHHSSFENDADLRTLLRTQDPDIVICEGNLPGTVLSRLRTKPNLKIFGFSETWSSGLPTRTVRSMLASKGHIGLELIDLSDASNVRILAATRSQLSSLALSHSVHHHFFKAAGLPSKVLTTPSMNHRTRTEKMGDLSHLEICKLTAKLIYRRIKHRLLANNDHAWSMAVAPSTGPTGQIKDLANMTMITPPEDRFWADPFVVDHQNQSYLFFEELKYSEGIGKIAVAKVNQDGLMSEPEIVLDKSWHLAYPQVFFHDSRWWMIPESGDAERVDLYVADDFPGGWRHVQTLIEGQRLFDSTLLHKDGLWWLFATRACDGISGNDELHLFSSQSLDSQDWQPHPQNPVMSDATCARPAGAFLQENGRLYRPSQDSRERYGYGLVMNEVVELSTSKYQEFVLDRILPERLGWGYRGMHTLNKSASLTTVDLIR